MKTTEPALRAHFPLADGTRAVPASFHKVYPALGHGFPERIYVRALAEESRERGWHVALEVPLDMFDHDRCVGTYRADGVAEGSVIVEVKAVDRLHPAHEAQLLHSLRSTNIGIGLLLNFGDRPAFRRVAYASRRKQRR